MLSRDCFVPPFTIARLKNRRGKTSPNLVRAEGGSGRGEERQLAGPDDEATQGFWCGLGRGKGRKKKRRSLTFDGSRPGRGGQHRMRSRVFPRFSLLASGRERIRSRTKTSTLTDARRRGIVSPLKSVLLFFSWKGFRKKKRI